MSNYSSNIKLLRQYVNGELSPEEMYAIERASHEDEMLMDIIEGLEIERDQSLPTPQLTKFQIPKQPQTIKPVISWKIIVPIAASLVICLGITLYWQTKLWVDMHKEIILAERPKMTEQTDNTGMERDTVPAAIVWTAPKADQGQPSTEPTTPYRSSITDEIQPSDSLHADEPNLIAQLPEETTSLRPTTDLSYIPRLEREEVITRIGKSDSSPLLTQPLQSALREVRVEQTAGSSNLARQQANLQKMNLDPETSRVLNEVMRRNATETIQESNRKNEELQLAATADSTRPSDALAYSKKSGRSPEKNAHTTTEGSDLARTVTSVEASNSKKQATAKSAPLSSWKAYKKYLATHTAVSKEKGAVKLAFSLDTLGNPQHIEVIRSSNPKLNAYAIDIVRQGGIWLVGSDAAHIELELKF